MTSPLATLLQEFKAGFASRAAPERIATMEEAIAILRASGIERQALRAGQHAPDVALVNARGETVRLSDLWRQGPLVITFYRGGWCPYCNLELRAWQQQLAELRSRGAQLAAISAQTPDNSLSTQQKNDLAFEVLSDSSLQAARGFGIAFDMPPELVALYASVGHDLPTTNGNGLWTLPVPATYALGTDGVILFSHVDVDYRNRAEPSEVLKSLGAATAKI
jgi:peroxiredoxin